jgi:hypothetical protein
MLSVNVPVCGSSVVGLTETVSVVPADPTMPLLGLTVNQVCELVAVKLVVELHVNVTVCAGGAALPCDCAKLSFWTGLPAIENVQPAVATFTVTLIMSGFAALLTPPVTTKFAAYVPADKALLTPTVKVAGVVPDEGVTVTYDESELTVKLVAGELDNWRL